MITNISMYDNYLYPGFVFPKEFRSYVSEGRLENIEPWWLFCSAQNYVDYWCKKVRELYPNRKLIPFANWRYTDDIVCFDGECTSGEPKIYYIHAFASAGWEDRGFADSFVEWLNMARFESARQKTEQSEDGS